MVSETVSKAHRICIEDPLHLKNDIECKAFRSVDDSIDSVVVAGAKIPSLKGSNRLETG